MPRRSILTAAEKESLIAIPETEEELIRYYTLSETDLSIIRQHRGAANRLGFAVQLCCMRYPGIACKFHSHVSSHFTFMFPPVSQTCFHLFHSKFPLGNSA